MAGRNSLTVKWDAKDLHDHLRSFDKKFMSAFAEETERYALVSQNHARTSAPWTDRTGNARQGLFAEAMTASNEFEIVLYHTMYYGVFLERRWDGRWGIIPDTVTRVSRVYTAAMTKRLADILRGS